VSRREFVLIYNNSKPVQVEKAFDALTGLFSSGNDDELAFLLCECASYLTVNPVSACLASAT